MNSESLMTHTLRTAPGGRALAEIMAAALGAAEPAAAVRSALRRDGDTLRIGAQEYDLRTIQRILIVGAGKAGAPMAAAAAEILEGRIAAGAMVVKHGHVGDVSAATIDIVEGGHPLPDAHGVAAAAHIAALLTEATAGDLVLVLISGGGSALLTLPAPGITLPDTIELTQILLGCGATINEINALRKHVNQLQGGRMAELAAPARVATLILSDVVGSPLDVIASGPTAPDTTTWHDAWAVVERHAIAEQLPARLRTHLLAGREGRLPDTPKPGDALFERVNNVVVGSNELAALAAVEAARAHGFNTMLLTTYLEGEAREAGTVLAGIARELALHERPLSLPALLIAGGETTVRLHGSGLGGRNQELALGAVRGLAGLPGTVLAALATDGGDGPTDAAGAVAGGETLGRAFELGLDLDAFLRDNDAYHFWQPLGDLLLPGPTLTNVNDLSFVMVGAHD